MREWNSIKANLIKSINELYYLDEDIFSRNKGQGIAERGIVFRLAYYLQQKYNTDYFVDCDFNSTYLNGKQTHGKPIPTPEGNLIKRFVDIIIHQRDEIPEHNLICFEIKKWNNFKKELNGKDRNNLIFLTNSYGYKYGFYIILGKEISEVKIEIYDFNGLNSSKTWEQFCDDKF